MSDFDKSLTLEEFLKTSPIKELKDELIKNGNLVVKKREEIETFTEKQLNKQEEIVKEKQLRANDVIDKNKNRIQSNNDRNYEMIKSQFDVAKTFALKADDVEGQEKWFNTMTEIQLETADAIERENEELKEENIEIKDELKKEKEEKVILEQRVIDEEHNTVKTAIASSVATAGSLGAFYLAKKYGPKVLNRVLTNLKKLIK